MTTKSIVYVVFRSTCHQAAGVGRVELQVLICMSTAFLAPNSELNVDDCSACFNRATSVIEHAHTKESKARTCVCACIHTHV